jgi:hypothetical protein
MSLAGLQLGGTLIFWKPIKEFQKAYELPEELLYFDARALSYRRVCG